MGLFFYLPAANSAEARMNRLKTTNLFDAEGARICGNPLALMVTV
jgi:hypothetical protein